MEPVSPTSHRAPSAPFLPLMWVLSFPLPPVQGQPLPGDPALSVSPNNLSSNFQPPSPSTGFSPQPLSLLPPPSHSDPKHPAFPHPTPNGEGLLRTPGVGSGNRHQPEETLPVPTTRVLPGTTWGLGQSRAAVKGKGKIPKGMLWGQRVDAQVVVIARERRAVLGKMLREWCPG